MTRLTKEQARRRASKLRLQARQDLDRAEQARSDALAALREADRIEREIQDQIWKAVTGEQERNADRFI